MADPTPEATDRATFLAAAGTAPVVRWRTTTDTGPIILKAVAHLTTNGRHLPHDGHSGIEGAPAIYASRADTKPGTPRTIVAITPGDQDGIEAAIDHVMSHPHATIN